MNWIFKRKTKILLWFHMMLSSCPMSSLRLNFLTWLSTFKSPFLNYLLFIHPVQPGFWTNHWTSICLKTDLLPMSLIGGLHVGKSSGLFIVLFLLDLSIMFVSVDYSLLIEKLFSFPFFLAVLSLLCWPLLLRKTKCQRSKDSALGPFPFSFLIPSLRTSKTK